MIRIIKLSLLAVLALSTNGSAVGTFQCELACQEKTSGKKGPTLACHDNSPWLESFSANENEAKNIREIVKKRKGETKNTLDEGVIFNNVLTRQANWERKCMLTIYNINNPDECKNVCTEEMDTTKFE